MVLNSLNFYLSINPLISLSILNKIFPGFSNHGCRFFSFSTLNISCHSFLAYRVFAERSTVNCMGFPLYVTSCFSLAAFNILSLCLISASLISTCFDRFSLGFILYRTHCAPWIEYFLSHAGEVFNCNCLKNFLSDFLFLFFLCDACNTKCWCV